MKSVPFKTRGKYITKKYPFHQMAVAQKIGIPKWHPGKWNHGPKPAVCPSDRPNHGSVFPHPFSVEVLQLHSTPQAKTGIAMFGIGSLDPIRSESLLPICRSHSLAGSLPSLKTREGAARREAPGLRRGPSRKKCQGYLVDVGRGGKNQIFADKWLDFNH